MNRMDKLTEARRLVGLYYDGDTSPADMSRLRGLLESLEPLPDDLAAELALLRLIDEAAAEIEVPEGLEATLRLNLHRQAEAEQKSRHIPRRMTRWMGWAAAVAVGLAIGGTYIMHDTVTVDLGHGTPMARVDTIATSPDEGTPTVEGVNAGSPAVAPQMAVASPQPARATGEKSPSVQPKPTAKGNPSAVETSSSMELTPEEAAALTLAFAEMREASHEVLSTGRQDLDAACAEMYANMADVRTQLVDGTYPETNYSDSETIIEP